ncbi:MAG: hypothetical protein M1358_01755 [Chloroflexi bacterium]|nr:hypothetical protein [Chloroflexota bacterium]
MDKLEVLVQPRTVLGKKVRHLRHQGWIPANVYGHGIASYPIQVEAKELDQVLAQAGSSKLISLRLPTSREARRVLVRDVCRNNVTGKVLHVEFYQVRMTEKLKAEVRLELLRLSLARLRRPRARECLCTT